MTDYDRQIIARTYSRLIGADSDEPEIVALSIGYAEVDPVGRGDGRGIVTAYNREIAYVGYGIAFDSESGEDYDPRGGPTVIPIAGYPVRLPTDGQVEVYRIG